MQQVLGHARGAMLCHHSCATMQEVLCQRRGERVRDEPELLECGPLIPRVPVAARPQARPRRRASQTSARGGREGGSRPGPAHGGHTKFSS